MHSIIRTALDENEVRNAYEIEAASYPPDTAAAAEAFMLRFQYFQPYFLVAASENRILGVANGVRLAHDDLSGEGMKQMSDYSSDGPYFCLLTVAVAPALRRQGIGGRLLQAVVKQTKKDHLQAIVLMCEAHLIPFYKKEGFVYRQPSVSRHGGAEWHEMRLELPGIPPSIIL